MPPASSNDSDTIDRSSHPGHEASLYFPSECGYLYVTQESYRLLMPHHATVLLTAPEYPAEIVRNGKTYRHCAIAVRPGAMELLPRNAPLLKIGINPLHPSFRAFSNSEGPDVILLERQLFCGLEQQLRVLLTSEATIDMAHHVMEGAIALAIAVLGDARPPDRRQKLLNDLLRRKPDCSLHELASELGLSYHRMSHAFKELTGLSLRNFKAWRKLHDLMFLLSSRSSMTNIAHAAGFTDSAHLLRQFQLNYGASPKYFFSSGKVKIIACEKLKQMSEAIRGTHLCTPKVSDRVVSRHQEFPRPDATA